MKTITTYEIYRSAYNDILANWSMEMERNERFLAEHGRPCKIATHRIEKYSAQLDELHEEMLKIEQQTKAAAEMN